jgi:hypothetical protein
VASAADGMPDRPQDGEDQADQDDKDANAPQNCELVNEDSDDEQEDAKDDHGGTGPFLLG